MGNKETFWIVPLLRSSKNRVHGPYGSVGEAREAGAKFIVAANILKVTIDDQPTLEVVDFIRNRYTR